MALFPVPAGKSSGSGYRKSPPPPPPSLSSTNLFLRHPPLTALTYSDKKILMPPDIPDRSATRAGSSDSALHNTPFPLCSAVLVYRSAARRPGTLQRAGNTPHNTSRAAPLCWFTALQLGGPLISVLHAGRRCSSIEVRETLENGFHFLADRQSSINLGHHIQSISYQQSHHLLPWSQ